MSNIPCIICNVMQEVPDAEGLMAVKCATCGKTQSEATIRERERIIKLIEELRQFMIKARQAGDVDILLAEERYARLIALIKGENK
jgi:hypothetical protein